MKVLVLGATPNPARFAYRAVDRLLNSGHEVIPVGLRKGSVRGIPIINHHEPQPGIDVITLYVGPGNQQSLYDYILKTRPRKIIFNPGTENPDLVQMAEDEGITTEYACTLVQLATGTFSAV